MAHKFTVVALVVGSLGLAACSEMQTNQDYGVDSKTLQDRAAGIWIDGNGCDHWIIDDGLEGYMSPRLMDDGSPVCRKGSVPFTVVDFERSLLGE